MKISANVLALVAAMAVVARGSISLALFCCGSFAQIKRLSRAAENNARRHQVCDEELLIGEHVFLIQVWARV